VHYREETYETIRNKVKTKPQRALYDLTATAGSQPNKKRNGEQ
jgi:hypothetical protein